MKKYQLGALAVSDKGLQDTKEEIVIELIDRMQKYVAEGKAPWDTEFQKRYCSGCVAENCDACPNERFRNNPEWWLSLEADSGVAL